MNKQSVDLEDQFPLCTATSQPVCNSIVERQLESSMSINDRVQCKLNANIQPTAKEEMLCTLLQDLPQERWIPVQHTEDKYLLSNKRRAKFSSTGNILNHHRFSVAFSIPIGSHYQCEWYNTAKEVYRLFDIAEIKPLTPLEAKKQNAYFSIQRSVSNGENPTPIDVVYSAFVPKLPNEEWVPVYGFESNYKVSTYGRVYSCYFCEIITPKINQHGYTEYALTSSNGSRYRQGHVLVMESFVDKCNWSEVVNHIDGDKLNNHISNLEWCTFKQNTEHAHLLGLTKSDRLTRESMERAIGLYESGMEASEIIKLPEYSNITYKCLLNAIFRKTYKFYDDIKIPNRHRNPSNKNKGLQCKHCKLSLIDILTAKILRNHGWSCNKIGNLLNVSGSNIVQLTNNHIYTDVNIEDYPELVKDLEAKYGYN